MSVFITRTGPRLHKIGGMAVAHKLGNNNGKKVPHGRKSERALALGLWTRDNPGDLSQLECSSGTALGRPHDFCPNQSCTSGASRLKFGVGYEIEIKIEKHHNEGPVPQLNELQ